MQLDRQTLGMVTAHRRQGLPLHHQLPLLPAHLSTHCITKISPTILPNKIMNSVTGFAPKRSIIPTGQGAWRTRKEIKHFASKTSTVWIINFFLHQNKYKNEIFTVVLTQTSTTLLSTAVNVYLGVSLQHSLLPLSCNTDLQQFKKTFELTVSCNRVGQHTNTWCLGVCPAKG